MALDDFTHDDPTADDADNIDRDAVIRAIGDLFPATFARFDDRWRPAIARHERFVRMVQYHVWLDQNTSRPTSAKRKAAMDAVVREGETAAADDTDNREWIADVQLTHLHNCLREGYADRASDKHLLSAAHTDLKRFAAEYAALAEHA